MIPLVPFYPTVILANGAFPEHPVPLRQLNDARRIIACDGAVEALLQAGREPDFIVGDLDSLSPELCRRYAHCLRHNPDQETNDLTKAVQFAVKNGWNSLAIVGATGKRDDHTLGNISLLADYQKLAEVCMLTDFGVFVPIDKPVVFESFPTQQVSIFSINPTALITTGGLKYPLHSSPLTSWWQGTLNEALSREFSLVFDAGDIIVYRTYDSNSTFLR